MAFNTNGRNFWSRAFDYWPTQSGFDRFYGFLQGETDQFHPELTRDNHHIERPVDKEEYHLSEDLVENACKFINDSKSIYPEQPFFLYLTFGATHAPHQAPEEFLQKYRGKFDEGWDQIRTEWFMKQKELGVIPADTVLADRNPGVEEWDSLSENQKIFACRLQEAFAAMLDQCTITCSDDSSRDFFDDPTVANAAESLVEYSRTAAGNSSFALRIFSYTRSTLPE